MREEIYKLLKRKKGKLLNHRQISMALPDYEGLSVLRELHRMVGDNIIEIIPGKIPDFPNYRLK